MGLFFFTKNPKENHKDTYQYLFLSARTLSPLPEKQQVIKYPRISQKEEKEKDFLNELH